MAGVNIAALSLAQTPPLSVPVRFFLTAPLFAVAAGLWLMVQPEAWDSRWMPALIGMTHLLTLGFMAMVMMGAIQQLLPVLMGSPVPYAAQISPTVHLLLTAGIAALCVGIGIAIPLATQVGVVLIALAMLIFLAAVAVALADAKSAHATVTAMVLAIVALVIAVLFGIYLASGWGWLGAPDRSLTAIHLLWALAGWVGLLVAGVAYQVVPMFQITPDYPKWFRRWWAGLVFALLILWSGAYLWLADSPLLQVVQATLGLLFAALALMTLHLQRRRKRRLADVTLDFWRWAMVCLLLASLSWPLFHVFGERFELAWGVLVILGFALGVISGMLYKILPFLVWLHLNNRLQTAGAPQTKVPNMRQIIPEKRCRWQYRAHVVTTLMLLAAIVWAPLTLLAGLSLAGSSLFLAANLFKAVAVYRQHLRLMLV